MDIIPQSDAIRPMIDIFDAHFDVSYSRKIPEEGLPYLAHIMCGALYFNQHLYLN